MRKDSLAIDVLPEIEALAREVLSPEKFKQANSLADDLAKSRKNREWVIASVISEVFPYPKSVRPSRPLYYWMDYEMPMFPKNTRGCIRPLGDYIDLLTKEWSHEVVGGNARRRSLGANAEILIQKTSPPLRNLAETTKKYASALYTPAKHDFGVSEPYPNQRLHRFTPREVILTAFITSVIGKQILSASKLARIAVEKDNLYSMPVGSDGSRWGSGSRLRFFGDSTADKEAA